MTTSSSFPQRGLDAGPIIYSLLDGHPASAVCEGHIRGHSGWLTTAVTLLEVDAVLRKVYGVAADLAARKLAQFANGPIVISVVDASLAISAVDCANALGIDLGDAVLLETCRSHGAATISTDDAKFASVCGKLNVKAETPIDSAMRRQIAAWESANVPLKGLARLLSQVRTWIGNRDSSLAEDFWNQTGAGSHVP